MYSLPREIMDLWSSLKQGLGKNTVTCKCKWHAKQFYQTSQID